MEAKPGNTPVILFHENPGLPHGRGRPYNTRMLVIISVASLSSGVLDVCVQRPQHHANASRSYRSSEQVIPKLLNFGNVQRTVVEALKLRAVVVKGHC